MALIGNYSVLSKNSGRSIGGGAIGLGNNRSDFNKSGQSRGRFSNDSWEPKSGVPDGYRPPYCWVIPQKDGALAARGSISGSGSLTASGTLGLNAQAALAGTSTFLADGTMVIQAAAALIGIGALVSDIGGVLQAVAALQGSGAISGTLNAVVDIAAALSGTGVLSADILGALQAEAALSGSGSVTIADLAGAVYAVAALAGTGSLTAAITGRYDMFADLTGSGSLVADLRALGHVVAAMTGTGTVAADITAKGNLSADVTPFTELSPESLAAAVWNAIAADFNDAGTMGNKVNSAASAGDPWGTELPGSYPPGSAGAILGELDTDSILDLTDGVETGLTVRQALRLITAALAGKLSGADTTTITIRNAAADSKDRIVATVTAEGDRTNVVLDLS